MPEQAWWRVGSWPTAHLVHDIGLHAQFGVLFTNCGKRIDQTPGGAADEHQRRCQPCATARPGLFRTPFDPDVHRADTADGAMVDLDALAGSTTGAT